MAYINENKELIITWCLDDVQSRAKDREIFLTDYQAQRVLELMCDKHDCTIGINWDFMDFCIDNILITD